MACKNNPLLCGTNPRKCLTLNDLLWNEPKTKPPSQTRVNLEIPRLSSRASPAACRVTCFMETASLESSGLDNSRIS